MHESTNIKYCFMLQNVELMTVTISYGPATLYFVVIWLLVTQLLCTQNRSQKRNLFLPLAQTARSPDVYHKTHTIL